MATNLVSQRGDRVVVSLSADVSSGAITRQKGIVGIPQNNVLSGSSVTFATEGIWNLTLSIQGTLGVGCFLYWDVSAGAASIGYANEDLPLGQIVKVQNATTKVYAVKLLPGPPRGQSQPSS